MKFPGKNPVTESEHQAYRVQLSGMQDCLKEMEKIHGQIEKLHNHHFPNVEKNQQILKSPEYKKVAEIVRKAINGSKLTGRDKEICQGLIQDFKSVPAALLHKGRQKDIDRIYSKLGSDSTVQKTVTNLRDKAKQILPKWAQKQERPSVQNSNNDAQPDQKKSDSGGYKPH